MIVLEIELTDAERGKYGLSNLVKAIAQSIPYLCMLLVRTEGVIRFFTFDRKENEFDDSRSRVRDICSSQDIIPIKEDISDGILITKLRASIANATSAEELNIEWSKLLKDCGLVLDTFDVSIDEYHHLLDKKLRFERIIEQDNDYEDDSGETDIFESDIFDGPTLEPSRETEEDMFVSFCTANVRTLYEEACEKDDLTEEKWLRNYIVACNDYANQLLVKSVNSKIAKEIVGAFFNRVDEEREEMQDTFDIEEFKECIVEHISYDTIEGEYDSTIFTAEKNTQSFEKAFLAKKAIQDYVFTDGVAEKSIERKFAEDLDAAEEVCVYAKLPRTFQIPTPVGNYSPDWAIAFYEGKVKHIFFVAETKGTMESLELRPIEQAKISCAKKLFNEMSTSKVTRFIGRYMID